MKPKTRISAADDRQDLLITRDFDLPVSLLFTAYTDPEIIGQWMGTNVLKLDNRKHGSWQFETTNAQGHVVFRAGGTIHEFIPGQKIVRTFEMENAPFGPQLEFLEFESLPNDTSQLRMHIVYRSVAQRNQQLQLPFAQGLNMAHNRLQEIVSKLQ
ncbi:SRPBCC family protein [Hymenobacter cellulosivorans]|uniref:SRPBCC domain-containing protein n=1 Tax=Hymenobacter cellulosivorans TaxID=2932249 RepID=A0ABY4FIC3_9BACT|nr:SRPBCC domain-containing protein [Hymenobacter cellulosivorans]UOQ55709.1 SRPBCC domain-containing protein [Hymenobacter cellulosivorans]